ncbi:MULTISPECIES: FAD-dependent oxidoreductase [Methylorubrum]|uniref:FAD-dependent oxidoreductase n=1 Tax=Methylorubrum TaxID=2282523 RepID=UPI00209D98C4|nr:MULTISPECIES: FAD-dependent oxidoreductase [Methylorubrum]MCP1550287.1 ferredoxin--NADP+ reductase [Methylorubrum zatmanii]MCP1553100.1 ferredoxin--NADP+ reductase [Methylorubrum extorquens]MCP1580590.1 ferredoxin--NADP+ reductase [Methylorubrum extorquens]
MSAPHRIAVVGSGPAGFYAAEALLRSGTPVAVDLFERLPAPFGLVRFGVAPDHPKLKQVTTVFDRIAGLPGFRFVGGIEVGADVSVPELRACYHAVILANGASLDRRMGIPGEDLAGSHQAGAFIGWYNGHPDAAGLSFDLSAERAVVIGHGNVALDVARILLKTPDELRHTDIAAHALDALAESRIREVQIVGRGGVARARFSPKELGEFGALADCATGLDSDDLPGGVPEPPVEAGAEARANAAILRGFSEAHGGSGKRRRCLIRFGLEPVRLAGEDRVERLHLRRPDSDRTLALECGLVVASIGRRTAPVAGIPYDAQAGVHANLGGRIVTDGVPVPGLYTCGWSKRGPHGTIGTNRACGVETAAAVLADLATLPFPVGSADALVASLAERTGHTIDYAAWRRIEAAETARGQSVGKPREKFVTRAEMLAVAGEAA